MIHKPRPQRQSANLLSGAHHKCYSDLLPDVLLVAPDMPRQSLRAAIKRDRAHGVFVGHAMFAASETPSMYWFILWSFLAHRWRTIKFLTVEMPKPDQICWYTFRKVLQLAG